MAETAAERDELEALAQRHSLQLLRRWLTDTNLDGDHLRWPGYDFHLGYGSWTGPEGLRGRGLLALRAHLLGTTLGRASKDVRTHLEDLGVIPRDQTAPKGKKGSRYKPVIPVPPEAMPLDWQVVLKDELFWRRLGMKLCPTFSWVYLGPNKELLGYVVRFDPPEGPKVVARLLWCGLEGWQLTDWPKPYPLYGLSELKKRPTDKVLIVEGEKTADAAIPLFPDYVVVTWPNGASAVSHVQWGHLKGRDVTVWRDADVEGEVAAHEVEAQLRRVKAKRVSLVDVPLDLPMGWDLGDAPPPGLDIYQLLESSQKINPEIERLNNTSAVVNDHGKVVVYTEEEDPHTRLRRFNRMSFTDFKNLHLNREIMIGYDGHRNPLYKRLGDFWLEHPDRREYQGVAFAPQKELPGYLNLWRGFGVEPIQGDWALLKEHTHQNICSGEQARFDYLFNWVAHKAQHPEAPGQVAIVMKGLKGIGKGVFAQAIGKLFGSHFQHISNAKHLTGHFNAHLRYSSLVYADEAFWAGDKTGESTLKTIITEDRLQIEGKGIDVIQAPNCIGLIISSNHDWVIPASLDERRFFVLEVKSDKRQQVEYFNQIRWQLEHGGYEALLYDLLNHDLSDFNLRVAPLTHELLEQKVRSLPPDLAWWLDILHSGQLPGDHKGNGRAPMEVLADSYSRAMGRTFHVRGAATKLGMSLPGWVGLTRLQSTRETFKVAVGYNQDGTVKLTKKFGTVTTLPSLAECRLVFEKMAGQDFSWQEPKLRWQPESWEEPLSDDEIPF